MEYKCSNCGNNEYKAIENQGGVFIVCQKCGYVDELIPRNKQPQQPQPQNIPKCPTCGSTNIRKIGTGERAVSVIGLGLLSKKINKTWKCNSCGHTW